MDFKDQWIDKRDGVDRVSAEHINQVAHGVIENEKSLKKTYTKGEANNLFCNALKGSASGEVVALNDVSPIEHEMGVTVSRKNLFTFDNVTLATNNADYVSCETGEGWMKQTFPKDATGERYQTVSFTFYPPKEMLNKPLIISADFESDIEKSGYIKIYNANGEANNVWGETPKNEKMSKQIQLDGVEGDRFRINFGLSGGADVQIAQGQYYKYSNVQIEPATTENATASAYAPYVDDISAVTVKTYGENLYNADNWTTAPYYSFCNIGNFPWRLTILDKDTSVDMSGIEIGVGQYSTSNIKAYSPAFARGTIRWATKDNIATHPDNSSVVGKNLLCDWLYIYPNTQEALDKVLQRFDIMVTGVNIIPTKQAPYIEPVTYPVSADGTVQGVTPIYPTTTLIADTEGAVIDCEYNRDLNKAFQELQQAILTLGV